MIRVLEKDSGFDFVLSVATSLEFLEKIQTLAASAHAESRSAASATLVSLNRLQRSFLAKRIPAASKDSTANVSNFLLVLFGAVETYLCEHVTHATSPGS